MSISGSTNPSASASPLKSPHDCNHEASCSTDCESEPSYVSDSGEGLWNKHGDDGDGTFSIKKGKSNQHRAGDLSATWYVTNTGEEVPRGTGYSKAEGKKPAANYKQPHHPFQENWKNGRPWLHYDKEHVAMKCAWCIKHAACLQEFLGPRL